MKENRLGLVHVYTGDGKGKTTAAIGLALRAAANDLDVCVLQFMKAESDISGEIAALRCLRGVFVERFGGNLLRRIDRASEDRRKEAIREAVDEGLQKAFDMARDGSYNLMVLDEINVAMSLGLADKGRLIELIGLCRSKNIELVLTGRGAPAEIIDAADYVTEMKLVKHPFGNGIKARQGIEY